MEANLAEGTIVEDSVERTNPPVVPAYEDWPSVPKGPVRNYYGDGALPSTSANTLSIEDIEAAQALEGLRTGTLSFTSTLMTTYLRPLTRRHETTTIST